jgi:hypothetical protein
LGSTFFKDYRDIKFAKNGLVDYFICILQDLGRNSNLNFKIKFGLDRGGFTGRRGSL